MTMGLQTISSIRGAGVTFASLALLGCGTGEPDYFPLSNGARWTYAIDFVIGAGPAQKASAVLRIEGTERIGDATYLKQVAVVSGVPGAEQSVEYLRVAGDGIYGLHGTEHDKPVTNPSTCSSRCRSPWGKAGSAHTRSSLQRARPQRGRASRSLTAPTTTV